MRRSLLLTAMLPLGMGGMAFSGCEAQRPARDCIDLGGKIALTQVTGGPPAPAPGVTTCNVFGTVGDAVRDVVSGGTTLFSIAIPKDDGAGPKEPYDANAIPTPGHFTFSVTALASGSEPCSYRFQTDGTGSGVMQVTELGDAPGTGFTATFTQVSLVGEAVATDGGVPDPSCPPASTVTLDGSFIAPMQR